jgi:TonB family protein
LPAAITVGGGILPKQNTKLRLTAEIMKMNTKSKIALSLGLLLAPLALMAKSPETDYVESYHGRTDIPVPVSVVMPDVPSKFAGQQVVLEFVVDAAGKPTLLASGTPKANSELVAAVLSAVEQWQFAPALANGKPVARKVVLPVRIVDETDTATRFALN